MLGQLGQMLLHLLGHHARNDVGTRHVEVRIILTTIGIEGRSTLLDPHKIGARRLITQLLEPGLGQRLHIEQHDTHLLGHLAYAVGILTVGLFQLTLLGEVATGNRGQKNRNTTLLARLADIAAQVLGKDLGHGAHLRAIHLLVVMAKLDKDVVALLHLAVDRLPATLLAERLGRATIQCMIFDHDTLVEEGAEQLSPTTFGVLLLEVLVGTGRVANQIDMRRTLLFGLGEGKAKERQR